jgi:Family of unknown function (DUF5995)
MGVTPRTLVAVLTVLLVLVAPRPAAADDPPFLDWASLLPALSNAGYEPSSGDECRAGRLSCIDSMIRQMSRRFDRLGPACDHAAIFSLAYLRTTEELRRAVMEPGFFEDPRFITHEGAVFTDLYFDAFDSWHSGNRAATPPAWAIAFDAAADRNVSGAGDLLLGMNAHIQRDRPFVLAAIGMVKPDGTSRKRDHDRVNFFLNRVADTMIPELARRFDPSIDDTNLPTTVDDMLQFQMIPAWRETAWRNAERLVAARTRDERARVAADIEAYAASQAQLLRRLTAYLSPLQDTRMRDAFCAANHG